MGIRAYWEEATNAIVKSGRFLLAVPMFVFPVLHFFYPDFVASIVPPWIPWHLFWTYFTALTIIAAGLSIVSGKYAGVAATLLGIEIFLFCALIHVPLLLNRPGDAWAGAAMFGSMPSRRVNAFKDFGLCGAVFVFAGMQLRESRRSAGRVLMTIGSLILALSIAGFGVLHFLYPAFAPGIPPMQVNISFPIPGHLLWVYLTGVFFVVSALCLAINQKVKTAATLVGLVILLFDLLTWVPIFIVNPIRMTGNWLKDIGIVGGVFILAESLSLKGDPKRSTAGGPL